jgi:ribose transport system ATP-binding protein
MHLQLNEISKSFGSVKALDKVSFGLNSGEVHALCGENGAGKSTLMNILAGNLQPSAGEIMLQGQTIRFKNNLDAAQAGIAIVYQHLSLVNTMTVAENIFANHPPHRFGFIQSGRLQQQTNDLLNKLKLVDIRADRLVGKLSQGEKQMVEIAKALAKNPTILILDEPTASVTHRETEVLFDLIREQQAKGVGVIYISHRLDEIFQIADRTTVLKDGKYQATLTRTELSREKLIGLMVGRDIEKSLHTSHAQAEVVLTVKHLTSEKFSDISFQLRKGEILALAGLQGAGRTEIAKAIFGADPQATGEIWLNGKQVMVAHPRDAIEAGIGYVPEERKNLGIFPEMTIMDNIISVKLEESLKNKFYDAQNVAVIAEGFKQKLDIVCSSIQQKVVNLSGGNQQKVVLAKWLLQNPEVLIIDEPTNGIDVGAKFEIYELLKNLAKAGKSILLISSELPEVISLADRILVIREGRLAGELEARDVQEKDILELAT